MQGRERSGVLNIKVSILNRIVQQDFFVPIPLEQVDSLSVSPNNDIQHGDGACLSTFMNSDCPFT